MDCLAGNPNCTSEHILVTQNLTFCRFFETSVEVLFKDPDLKSPELGKFEKLSDNFFVVSSFDGNGVAEVKLDPALKVSIVRLSIHQSSENWAILSEIHLRASQSTA